jgi:delta-1-pyrroline-5-carboxylate synthetase
MVRPWRLLRQGDSNEPPPYPKSLGSSPPGTDEHLIKRLKLTRDKLQTLSSGILQIAAEDDPLGVVKSKLEVAEGLVLTEQTVPIGVLMIIFESRPDSFPQIAALSIAR